MRSLVAWGMERPGTSFRTTETVAGFNPKCSASFFRLMRSFLAGGFFPKSRFFLFRPPRVHFGRRNAPPRKCAFPELRFLLVSAQGACDCVLALLLLSLS